MGYFDDILATFEDADDREQFRSLASKNPRAKEIAEEMGAFDEWQKTNWDAEHNMTKTEYLQSQSIRDLQDQLAAGTEGEVDFTKMESWLDTELAKRKIAREDPIKNDLDSRERKVVGLINTMEDMAVDLNYLNLLHNKEYGEPFDPKVYIKGMSDTGLGPRDYYEKFTADKREARRATELEDRIKRERREEREKALQEVTMSPTGQMPTVDGGPEMSSFQRKILAGKAGSVNGEPGATGTEHLTLGNGSIARVAAQQYRNKGNS
jgi:hypothetical protein